jgi:hypothetical protein
MRAQLYFLSQILSLIVLTAVAFGQDTNFPTGPQYLMNYGLPLFARSIATPSLSLSGPPLEVGASIATAGLSAGAENQTRTAASLVSRPAADLFSLYYGVTPVRSIEINLREVAGSSDELPASIQDTGVDELSSPDALRERGYGLTLSEAAAQAKAHMRHAVRVYTNADIDRLRAKG